MDIKKKMKALWKETFHDSDEYIDLVFDACYNPDFVEVEMQGDELVAGLLGVPYAFGTPDRYVRGLYLCGLATKTQYRSRGIMTRLLSNINKKAAEAGFAFTFLIPASEGLRKYYHDRDYVNAFYRVTDNYTSLHDFDMEYESILMEQKEKVAELKRRFYASLKTGKISAENPVGEEQMGKLTSLVEGLETSQRDLQLIHSRKDIETMIRENSVSKGAIYYSENSGGELTAAAFCSFENQAVVVEKLYYRDLSSKYKVLSFVKSDNPELSIHHYISSVEMDRKALWSRTYGSFLPEAPQVGAISMTERVYSLSAHAKIYGMARILDLHEILKFQAEGWHDLKYSILAKTGDVYSYEYIDVRHGKLTVKKMVADSLSPEQTAHVMSKRDIGEILFRRRDTDNMVTEAFGIPSINASACLLLD